jgi:hypothetical protein
LILNSISCITNLDKPILTSPGANQALELALLEAAADLPHPLQGVPSLPMELVVVQTATFVIAVSAVLSM